ncbi:class I SAM-dependent methyltransferase [Chitinispirillales bacterium ANBcel5]|uniref:class I SAM-dependent methyltransferase n=1 Tax=Cellulosispirillum alkaliphilum TaxID=3039283 RepID=UPI002A505908|nr:class I SAM-dependent methyltransferase [Chitinispirillales bacterium ANBcel5]
MSETRACEICGSTTYKRFVGKESFLFCCNTCRHSMRDLDVCHAGARLHAWGGSDSFDAIRSTLTLRRIRKLLKGQHRLSVLEIGFGSGKLLAEMHKAGHSISGIEAGLLEKDTPPLIAQNGTLYLDSVENIALPEESFDFVYAIHVAEHLKDPVAVMKKCAAALKKGGTLYLLTPNGASKGLTLFKEAWWNFEDPTHIRFFSPDSIRHLLESAGFSRVKVSIPLWDSLTLEVNSALRAVLKDKKMKHGILEGLFTKFVDIALLPPFLLSRCIIPSLAPTIEIVAEK